MTEHLPDNVVKAVFRRACNANGAFGLLSDGTHKLDDKTFILFEYENSSRGFVHHALKYNTELAQYPDVSFFLVFIESVHHQETHQNDRTYAENAVLRPNITMCTFMCDGNVETLEQTVLDFIASHS